MKNTFSLIAAAGLLLALSSCKKDEVQVKADVGAAPVLASNTTSALTLVSTDVAKTALVYTWSPVTFALSDGSKAVIPTSYTLEFAKTGTNFATFSTLSAGSSITRDSVKVGDLNSVLVKAGLTPTITGTVDVRLRANYAGNQSDLVSNTVKLTATPYSRELYFFGASLGPLSSSSPYISEQPGQHEGYIYFPNATNTFKLSNTSTPAGTVFGAGAGTTTGNLASGSASELTLAGPRMYRIRVNLATNTLTAVATDWGVIGSGTTGDGTGWNQSVPMTYSVADKVWKLTNYNMPGSGTNNEFKFRANDAWDINYGDSKTTPNASKLDQDGNNLKTAGPGRYDIVLDLNNPDKYTYTLTKK
ncbi:hypothetical protein ACVWYF_003311 [Hymenobacter sp. UYAg731]